MCEIVFCDSGISKEQMAFVQTYDIGYGIYDTNGHGSALIGLIHQMNKDIKLTSIKMLDENNEGSLEGLIIALEKCMDLKSRIICLALSIDRNVTENKDLQDMITKLTENKKILVAALHNQAEYSIPAGYPSVIGVRTVAISNHDISFYKVSSKIQCELPMESFFCKSYDNEFIKIGGNSVACAFFAEHIASLVDSLDEIQLDEIQNTFAKQKIQDVDYYRYFDRISIHSLMETDIKNTIERINRQIGFVNNEDILSEIRNLKQLDYYLKELEKRKLIINRRTFLRKYDLRNINTLTNYFEVQKLEKTNENG